MRKIVAVHILAEPDKHIIASINKTENKIQCLQSAEANSKQKLHLPGSRLGQGNAIPYKSLN